MLIGLGLGLTQARRAAAAGGGFTAFAHGFNFRATIPFVTDAAGDSYVASSSDSASLYPSTRDGVTFGWEDSAGNLDRSAAVDARFAGIVAVANNNATRPRFRLDLPAVGTYDIRLSIGDQAAGEGPHTVELLDTVTSKFIVSGVSSAADNYLDAFGTSFTRANWPTGNVARSVTFASTILRLRIGEGTGSGAVFSTVTHLKVTRTA